MTSPGVLSREDRLQWSPWAAAPNRWAQSAMAGVWVFSASVCRASEPWAAVKARRRAATARNAAGRIGRPSEQWTLSGDRGEGQGQDSDYPVQPRCDCLVIHHRDL